MAPGETFMAAAIETDRLFIQRLRLEDAPALFALRADPSVSAYDSWVPYTRLDQAVQHIVEQIGAEADTEGRWIDWAIVLKENSTVIGVVETVVRSRAWGQLEIGWALLGAFRGKGYATEAARRLITFAFHEMGMHRISAECDPRNTRSVRLLERLGMRREGHLKQIIRAKGIWCDRYVYGILEHEWLRDEK